MRILAFVSYKVFPAEMGGQKGIVDFYKSLAHFDEIFIACAENNNWNDIPFEHKYNQLYVQGRGIANLIKVPALIQYIKRNNIQAIIIEHSYWGWLGYLLHIFTGLPYIIHSHNIEGFRFKLLNRSYWKLYLKYEKWMHQLCTYNFFKCEEDADYAIKHWKWHPSKLAIVRYGTFQQFPPSISVKNKARKAICSKYNIAENNCLLLFNGTLNYAPNIEALQNIIHYVIPLLRHKQFNFTLIICGTALPTFLKDAFEPIAEIKYIGYVRNIDEMNLGVDAFIHPGTMATGIKTKLVEALAQNTTVITTTSGSRVIPNNIAQEKLWIVADNDMNALAEAIILATKFNKETPNSFYKAFFWGNIAQNAHSILENLHGK
jgi:hypothetical protein